MSQHGGGYAQQDAEEAWLRLVTALQNSLQGAGGGSASNASFIEQYMTGRMQIK
jgi:ubiquitin carboxyl-terminal hydrolase 14